ncbi:MAG: zinc-finger domain-containing protein [Rhodospirillaceae bacterium]|nr:zinc-finger domain-containing protein [Rhodospirillaceae bacterium]
MAEPFETIKAESTAVNCDGGGGALGHPRVYLQIKPEVGAIECPYCSRRYVLTEDARAQAGGH